MSDNVNRPAPCHECGCEPPAHRMHCAVGAARAARAEHAAEKARAEKAEAALAEATMQRARSEGIILAALAVARDRYEAAEAALRSPPIPWATSTDRQSMTATLDCGVATIAIDGRLELRCTRTNTLLARLDVHSHDGDIPNVFMDRADSQREIAAALLWSHRRSHGMPAYHDPQSNPPDSDEPASCDVKS